MGKLKWAIPQLWPDSTVYIIGGGPSVKDTDLSPIFDKRVIGVNSAYTLGQWVDVCWFGDCRWYHWNHVDFKKYAGLKLTCCSHAGLAKWPGVCQVIRGNKPEGIDKRPRCISWNKNSGGSAINVAYHLGARRIILIGYDMHIDKDGNHNWHKLHNHRPVDNIYKNRFYAPFKIIRSDAKKLGVEILNATPGSSLDLFPMVALEEVV